MPKTPRIPIPPVIRQYVLDRDQHQCRHCGAQTHLEIDHIIPLAQGGTNDLSNLQTLCRPCNAKKKHSYDGRSRRHFT